MVENTPKEIFYAVKDFYELFYKRKKINNNNKKLIKNFWQLFPYDKNIHGKIKTIISPNFLKNNQHLLK
jgi:hypothetical protein